MLVAAYFVMSNMFTFGTTKCTNRKYSHRRHIEYGASALVGQTIRLVNYIPTTLTTSYIVGCGAPGPSTCVCLIDCKINSD